MTKKTEKEELQKLIKKLAEAPKESARARAAQAIGKLGEEAEEAVPVLLKVMTEDKSERVRGRAALALGRIGKKETLSVAIKAMQEDESAQVRSRVAWSLGEYGEKAKEAINPLWTAVKEERNQERKFYFLFSLAKLEGEEGEGIKELERMKEQGEMEKWQYVSYENLCKELNIQAKVKEATESIASVKAGAQLVEAEVESLRKKVEDQPEGKAKEDLLSVTLILQRMIDDQQKTILRQEETIKGLNEALQELVKAHQKAIQEPRLTAEQFQDFKEKEFRESWFRRNLPALIGAMGTVAGGIGTILGFLLG